LSCSNVILIIWDMSITLNKIVLYYAYNYIIYLNIYKFNWYKIPRNIILIKNELKLEIFQVDS
jgi:hypothetical protein